MHPGPFVLHRRQSYHCAHLKRPALNSLHPTWFLAGLLCQANPTMFVAAILVVLLLFASDVMSFH